MAPRTKQKPQEAPALTGLKAQIARGDLRKALGVVSHAISARASLPVLQNARVEAKDGHLEFMGTNLEISIAVAMPATIEQEGAIGLPVKLLSDLIAGFNEGPISLSSDNSVVTVVSGKNVSRLNSLAVDDFPPMPTVKEGVKFMIDPGVMQEAVKRVAIAAATEESRPILTGVEIRVNGGEVTFAAADGFRLAVFKSVLLTPVDQPMTSVIPAKALIELQRILVGEEPLEVEIGPTMARFVCNGVTMTSTLLSGVFPKYDSLIPTKRNTRVILEAKETLKTMRMASLFAKEGSDIIRMKFSDKKEGLMMVSAKAEVVGDYQSEVPMESIEGVANRVAVNAKYLSSVMGVFEGKVAVDIIDSSSAVTFRTVDSDRYTYVVMPMFVQWD